jgi:hypothetical protein
MEPIAGAGVRRHEHEDDVEAARTSAPARADAPWEKEYPALRGDGSATAAARIAAVVHPERSFVELPGLTTEIFRLKGELAGAKDPELAATIRMRVVMLQGQWCQLATAAGIPQPKGRLDPLTAKSDEIARAFMWSEAGGMIPRDELATDGGRAFQASVRDAVRRLVSTSCTEDVQKELEAGKKQLYIGLDGFVGTDEQLTAYERAQTIRAARSTTTTGSIAATYLGGGDATRMRALGTAGSVLEAAAGTRVPYSAEQLHKAQFSE